MRSEQGELRGHIEQLGGGHQFTATKDSVVLHQAMIERNDAEHALKFFLQYAVVEGYIHNTDDIDMVGIRVVAPGTYFEEHRFVDDRFISSLVEAKERAPIHVSVLFDEIVTLREMFKETPLFGISDSAFHKGMPEYIRRYPIPTELTERFGAYRFGYHGLSVGSVARALGGDIPPRMIVCHLGSGASITALHQGKTVDTTMGHTPLEGVMMGTRSGSIDPGLLLMLMESTGMHANDVSILLNQESGLLGVSGVSNDVRELLKREEEGDPRAKLALHMFVHTLKRHLGAMFAVLGNVDLIVFTGTIGERSAVMRSRILVNMEGLGIVLSDKLNSDLTDGGYIHATESRVALRVVATDEMGELLRLTEENVD